MARRFPLSRFSLRALLTVMAVLCVVLALTPIWFRAQAQRSAVGFIRGIDPSWQVHYDYEYERDSEGAIILDRQLPNAQPSFFSGCPWLGVDMFHDVVAVEGAWWADSLNGPSTDGLWLNLNQLPRLQSIELPNHMLTVEHLQSFRSRQMLRQLRFNLRMAILDADSIEEKLKSIEDLSQLQSLSFELNIRDESLKSIGKFTNLRTLELYGGRVTATGWEELADHPNLQSPTVESPDAEAEFCAAVARCPKLEQLTLFLTEIEDQHLAAHQFPALQELVIAGRLGGRFDGTCFSDGKSWPALERLSMRRCDLSTDGLRAIAQLPRLKSFEWKRETPAYDMTSMTGRELEAVSWSPTIEVIHLTSVRITEAALRKMVRLPNIKRISTDRFYCSKQTLQAIAIEFPEIIFEGHGYDSDDWERLKKQ